MSIFISNRGATLWGMFFSLILFVWTMGCDDQVNSTTADVAVIAADIPLQDIGGAVGTPSGEGKVIGARKVGDVSSEYLWCLKETEDHGFVASGHTRRAANSANDAWLTRMDRDLNVLWSKSFSCGRNEHAYAVIPTRDNGVAFAGEMGIARVADDLNLTESYKYDAYIVKLDGEGEILWERHYGGDDYDRANDIGQTDDGGYVVAGHTQSYGALYKPEPHAKKDAWLFKLDDGGDIKWNLFYGEKDASEGLYAVCPAPGGGYMAAGFTDGAGAGGVDGLIMHVDGAGKLIWAHTLGGPKTDVARCIKPTVDGGYLVCGETMSSGNGLFDGWVVKLDNQGNVVWETTVGGGKFERAFAVLETADRKVLVAGYTSSEGAGDKDMLLVCLSGDGALLWSNAYGGYSCDKASTLIQRADGAIMMAGPSSSYGNEEIDSLILTIDPGS